MRILQLAAAILVALAPCSADAASDADYLQFYPPFDVIRIAELVRDRQEALRVEQFHAMLTVRYGRRTDWINACAWLKAQTDDGMQFYKPPQNGSDEYEYFCGMSRTYDEVSLGSLSDMSRLIDDLTRQFGGAITRWGFILRDDSNQESGIE